MKITEFIKKWWPGILLCGSGWIFVFGYLLGLYFEFGSITGLVGYLRNEMSIHDLTIFALIPIMTIFGIIFIHSSKLQARIYENDKKEIVNSAILKAKKEWEETFDIVSDSITIHDKDFNIIRANKAAEKLLGVPFKKLLQQKCYMSYHGNGEPPANCPSCHTLKSGVASVSEIYEPHLNKYIEIKALPRIDKQGELIGVVHVVSDISHKKKMEDDLRKVSITDELTGLYNRRGFLAMAEQQLKLAHREKRGAALLFMDLDGFKCTNDIYGHEEGDRVLVETTRILKDSFRESDIIARIGGDEFVILAMETSGTGINVSVDRLQSNIGDNNSLAGKACQLSLSMGISRYDPESPSSISELLSKADKLMYEEKKTKKE